MFSVNKLVIFRGEPFRFRGGVRVKDNVSQICKSPYMELVGHLTKKGLKRRAKAFLSTIMLYFYQLKYLPEISISCFDLFWEREVMSKIMPLFDLKKKKSGPKILYIPKPIRIKKSRLFAFKWFFFAVKARKELSFFDRVIRELFSIIRVHSRFFSGKYMRKARVQSKTLDMCRHWHLQGMENIALMTMVNLPGKIRFRKRKHSRRISRRMLVFLPEIF